MTHDEQYWIAKHVKRCRQKLGYTRYTFGRMLGMSEKNAKLKMRQIESGQRQIGSDRLTKINQWISTGVPEGSPKPTLMECRARYIENKRAENTPRVIELRG